MSKIQKISKCFLKVSTEGCYHNKWFGDEAWRQILEKHFDLRDITNKCINRCLFNAELCLPLILLKQKKQITTPEEKSKHAYFYCIADGTKTKQELYNNIDWQDLYYYFRLPRFKRKLQEEVGECDASTGKC